MAMSRSLAGVWVMSFPSSSRRPALMSSRPATMRSVVDLPQPEGPTSTISSPSFTSRLKS